MTNLHSESENADLDPNHLYHEQFPAGLRILVVDDDVNTLKIIEQMSIQCHYNVTTCSEAHVALNLLMEKKDSFDVVLSDVHMPDMQDYSFFQHVDQEFNLPLVIMLSREDSTSIGESIKHLACHYLIKPLGAEDLQNIWQHVVRKNLNAQDNKQLEEHNNDSGGGLMMADNTNDSDEVGIFKEGKKREAGDVAESADCTIRIKKPRVVWTKELHGLFMNAINHLGDDKAVPKKILDFMNVPYLTRENVASHLQKYRLHLNKKDEEAQGNSSKMQGASSSVRRPHNQAMPHDDDHVSPERGLTCPGIISKEDQIALLKSPPTMQHHHSQFHAQQPFDIMPKYDPNSIAKNFPHQPHLIAVDDDASSSGGYYGSWPPSSNAAIGSLAGPVQNNADMLKSIYHQMMLQQHQQQNHQQQQQYQQLQQAMMKHHIHSSDSIHNIQQPPCLVGPSSQQPLETTPAAASLNHNYYTFGARNHHPLVEHYSSSSTFLPQTIINNTLLMNIAAEFPHGARDFLSGYAAPSSVSPPPPGFSSTTIFQQHLVQNSTSLPFVGGGAVVRSVSPVPAATTQLVPNGGSNSRSSIDSSLNHQQGELVSRERQSHSNILKARNEEEEEPETHLFIINNTQEEGHSL